MFENMACNRNFPSQYFASRSDIQEENCTLEIISVMVFYEVVWQKFYALFFVFEKTDVLCSNLPGSFYCTNLMTKNILFLLCDFFTTLHPKWLYAYVHCFTQHLMYWKQFKPKYSNYNYFEGYEHLNRCCVIFLHMSFIFF